MATRSRRRTTAPPRKLDEALHRLITLLAACGYCQADIRHAMRRALIAARIPKPAIPGLDAEFVADAPHVITLWYQDPQLLRADGAPRPLPLKGPAPSLEALVRQLKRPRDSKIMIEYLRHIKGIKAVRGGWVPANRYLLFADPVGNAVHALEGTLGFLRTTNRNIQQPKSTSWFEARLTTRPLPKSQLLRVDRLVRHMGHEYLATLDRRLGAMEDRSTRTRDTTRIGIGSYYYELPD